MAAQLRQGFGPGDTIRDRYEIVRVLRGGMGVVYVGYDREWRETFAAKTFQDVVFARAADVAERFVREALAWIALDVHPHVTEARRVEEIDGRPFLFLEYVSGGDLASWIGSPRLTGKLRRVLRLALQFCDGMTHAAAKGIVAHRDIKPGNCLITADGDLKITDFGLAKAAAVPADARGSGAVAVPRSGDVLESRTGEAAGTPQYMAPEQFEDVKHVDGRADVYALGVMLFEMMTGVRPFRGSSIGDLGRQHRLEPPPPLPNAPPALADIVSRCLAKNADDRFPSFSELRAALAGVYRHATGGEPPEPVSGDALDAARLNNKALSLTKLGRAEEALESFEASLRLDARAARVWANKAAALGEKLGRWEEALASTERALAVDPADASAWSNHGMALRATGRVDEALACYDHALALDTASPATWSNKAAALLGLGRHGEALAAVSESLALDAAATAALSNKSVILRALGRPDDALACDDQAVALDERDERLWHNRSATLLALRRPDEALASTDRALSIEPRFTGAWLNKSLALRALGRLDEALGCARRAVDLDPTHVTAWSTLGNTLLALGQNDEAVLCYDRAIGLDSHHGVSWLNKGVVLLESGRVDEAVVCLEAAERAGVAQATALLSHLRAGT